jgi:hypothetical protein
MTQQKEIGKVLLAKGLLTRSQLSRAQRQSRSEESFGDILTDMGLVTELEYARCLAEEYGLPLDNLNQVLPTKAALSLVQGEFALKHLILPVSVTDEDAQVVVADPEAVPVGPALSWMRNRRIILYIAPANRLRARIKEFYDLGPGRPGQKVTSQLDRQAILAILTPGDAVTVA